MFNRVKKRLNWTNECGVETLEYIGMTAVVVALLGAIALFVATDGGQQVTQAAASTIGNMLASFEGGGRSGSLEYTSSVSVGTPRVGQPGVGRSDAGAAEAGEPAVGPSDPDSSADDSQVSVLPRFVLPVLGLPGWFDANIPLFLPGIGFTPFDLLVGLAPPGVSDWLLRNLPFSPYSPFTLVQRLHDLGRQDYQQYAGDPVSVSTGNFVYELNLLRIPGRDGLDFDITLTYNAQDRRKGIFGYGWSTLYDTQLTYSSEEIVDVRHADGRTHRYRSNDNRFETPAGVYDTLVKTKSGWQLTTPDQMVYNFEEIEQGVGRLTEIQDRRGNSLTLTYDANGDLIGVTDDAGRILELHYTDGRVTQIDDFAGRSYVLAYTDGNLTGITDANGGTQRLQYDDQHRVTHIWDEEDILFLQNIYDDQDRVVEQIDASGSHSYFTYNTANKVTTFTDNLGHVSRYFYDEQNRVTMVEDASGNVTRYEYDADYNLIREVDARGYETLYEYDTQGNLTKRVDPIDDYSATNYSSDVTSWEYNEWNDPIKMTDALGQVTTYEYDANGNLIAVHEPGGRETTSTYNAWGQLTRETDANGHTTTYEYDDFGNLIKITDAEGNVTTYRYDPAGRVIAFTDANGHTVTLVYDGNNNIIHATDPKGRTADLVYDGNDLLIQVTDRRGGVTHYEYDKNLRLTSEIDPEGYRRSYDYDLMYNRTKVVNARGNASHVEYDNLYRLIKNTDANGHTTIYEYDELDNLTAIVDAQGQRTKLIYDAVNRLISLIDPLGHETEFGYDALDRLIYVTGPRGGVTRYEYDQVGDLIKMIDPLNEVTTFNYDSVGNLRFLTDPNDHTREYVYDRINRLTGIVDPLRNKTQITYDPVGNILTLTDPEGNVTVSAYDENNNLFTITDGLNNTTRYIYDEEDDLVSLIDQRGNTTSLIRDLRGLVVGVIEPGNYKTQFEYDGNANLTGVTNAKGQMTSYVYDPVNLLIKQTNPLDFETLYDYDNLDRLVAVIDAEKNATGYAYDALGRLTSVADALNNVTRYAYDPVGNLLEIIDANGAVTHFEYNLRNDLVKEINPLGNTWQYQYDGAGNLITRRDANGNLTSYDLDAADRLVRVRYPSAIGTSGPEVTFDYDASSNQTTMTDWNGTITHQYDALNRLVQTTNFDGAILSYNYDAASNLTGLTYPNGQTVSYDYDARNLLSSLTDPAGRTTSYTYDPLGALSKITRPNGADTAYTYDQANRLTGIDHRRAGEPFTSFGYILDKVGNRTQITERRTFSAASTPIPVTTIKTYNYDALYRLTGADTDQGQEIEYTFDSVGNRLSQTGIPQAIDPTDGLEPLKPGPPLENSYSYNAANQLTSISTQEATISLEFDNNGNRIREMERLLDGTTHLTEYTYDYENRLVGVKETVSDGKDTKVTMLATYTYDGYGRRVRKEVTYPEPPVLALAASAKPQASLIPPEQQVITYLYDGLNVVVDYETVDGLTMATHYYWANGAIAEIERLANPENDFAGDVHWTHTDGLGSLVDLTNSNGDVTSQLYYNEYGQMLTEVESLSRYSYTGQEYDPETRLYHFFARYYGPITGMWTSQDEYRGTIWNPTSLHRLIYVLDNPVNYVDPFGYYVDEDKTVTYKLNHFEELISPSFNDRNSTVYHIDGGPELTEPANFTNPPILYTNGILTDPDNAILHAESLSKAQQAPVILVHNPSNGFVTDMLEAGHQKFLFPISPNEIGFGLFRDATDKAIADTFSKHPDLRRAAAHSQGSLFIENFARQHPYRISEGVSFGGASRGWPNVLNQKHIIAGYDLVALLFGADNSSDIIQVPKQPGFDWTGGHGILEHYSPYFNNAFDPPSSSGPNQRK